MLKCKEIARLSSDYLEREMTLGQRMSMSMHLLMCGKCSQFVRHMKVAVAYFNALGPTTKADDADAPDVDAIVRRAIEQQGH